jgi:hypothetical protein
LQELVWSLSYIENEAYQPHNLRTNMAQWTKKDGKVESVDTTLVYFNIKTHWICLSLHVMFYNLHFKNTHKNQKTLYLTSKF